MGQSTILASGTTGATSSDVSVAAGSIACVGVFMATGSAFSEGPLATVVMDTPGGDVAVKTLTEAEPVTVLSGPGTFRVVRAPCSVAIGVFSET